MNHYGATHLLCLSPHPRWPSWAGRQCSSHSPLLLHQLLFLFYLKHIPRACSRQWVSMTFSSDPCSFWQQAQNSSPIALGSESCLTQLIFPANPQGAEVRGKVLFSLKLTKLRIYLFPCRGPSQGLGGTLGMCTCGRVSLEHLPS